MMDVFVSTLGFLLLASLVAADWPEYYGDQALNPYTQELYKRLAELGAYGGDPYAVGAEPSYYYDDDLALDSRSLSPVVKDVEYEAAGPGPEGFQYISGGAGEGLQHLTPEGGQNNTQEVKTDQSLPFYCHPPNPCPKGFTAADGCDENVTDTAEAQKAFINEAMRSGACACDDEHMFNCPVVGEELDREEQSGLDGLLGDVLEPASAGGNPLKQHDFIVAKKGSPAMISRSKKALETPILRAM